jgi:hypothetical protein
MCSNPDQESRGPELLVGDVMTELVGEVESELAERLIEIKRNRRLNEPRPNGRLIRHTTHIGKSSGELAALGDEQRESLSSDVVPCHPVASLGLKRQLQSTGVGVQGVGDEVPAQPTTRCAATARFEAMLRRVSRRCTPWCGRCVVVTDAALRSYLQPIGQAFGKLVAF